jgi:hypothetical protein
MKRFASLTAAAGAVATISVFALAGGAGAASSLPTLTISESGTAAPSLSSTNLADGATTVTATHSGKGMGAFGLVRLNPNESPSAAIQAGFSAVQAAHGNLDALTATGNVLFASANAPGTIQVNLTAGDYVAINLSGMGGPPGFTQFHVHSTGSPAALPTPAATQTSIEFGFKGPKVLKNGSLVRAVNGGFLVHMIDLIGVKNKADAQKVVGLLRKGAGRKKVAPFLSGVFVSLLDPASPGAEQQLTLNAKPGFYVEACFMNTQDGREHTQLGMERIVRVK